jgi:hypothetical protein
MSANNYIDPEESEEIDSSCKISENAMMVGFNRFDTDPRSFVEFDQDRNNSGKDLDVDMDESVNKLSIKRRTV